MELQLTLTFACHAGGHAVSVTLKCTGPGLAETGAEELVAAINVPCPTCAAVSQVLFEPVSGAVRDVRPPPLTQPRPVPSAN
jgi:hypothetical protein